MLAILVTLAAMAVPRYGLAQSRYRADSAARRIVADLRLARAQAQSTSVAKSLAFDIVGSSYKVSGVQSLDRSGSEYIVHLSADPYRARIVSADFGGDVAVTFDMYGQPDSGGSVVLKVGDELRQVVLDADSGEAMTQ